MVPHVKDNNIYGTHKTIPLDLEEVITYHFSMVAVVIWLEYCRYGVKHKNINQPRIQRLGIKKCICTCICYVTEKLYSLSRHHQLPWKATFYCAALIKIGPIGNQPRVSEDGHHCIFTIFLMTCRVIHFNNHALLLREIIFDNLNQKSSLVFFYAIILLRGKLQKIILPDINFILPKCNSFVISVLI